MYFKRQVELSTMYRTMELINVDTAEDAIDKVRNGLVISCVFYYRHTVQVMNTY